ncbi:hypothetical protein MSAN_00573900 [Mycena sanguinolenta]|uniref:Uncharacterized protein n=1 Tax=Mycena sanguinolenta TaxID=230812 RepID=A0A8H6Z6U6_9AGAR|nr:hypothetical protein MSAN_00573900 [Mycena sanguinolenta]
MFSTLSHFLPASLHPTSTKTSQIRDEDEDEDDPGNKSDKSDAHADEVGVLKKKKEKSANETFIFVRPPPAKSNHPLNLQVQLVPPNSRGPSGLTSASRQSLDLSASGPAAANSAPGTPVDTSTPTTPATSADEHSAPNAGYQSGVPLTRTASARSTASSTYSATSTNTSASTSSTASSRRMIVPLYNLQAHNVMTNIIVDAGTDAKIARFTKRGIEMLDLAVFEPVEVYAGGGPPDAVPMGGTSGFSTRSTAGKNNTNSLTVPGAKNGGSRPTTPDPASSQASLTNSSLHSQHDLHHSVHSAHSNNSHSSHSPEPTHAPGTATPQAQSKRKFLGNLFKKKDGSSPAVGASPASDASLTPTQTPGRLFGHARTRSALAQPPSPSPRTSIGSAHRSSVDVSVAGAHDEGLPPTPSTPTHPQTQPHAQVVQGRQPILGLLASISSPVHPPKGRPGLYVWVAKRWLKDHFGGGLLKVAKGMVRGHGGEHDLTAEVEVRFEWKRGKGRRRKDKEREREKDKDKDVGGENGSRVARRQASTSGLVTPQKRLSTGAISRQSSFSITDEQSVARRRSLLHSEPQEDSGDESDPEDSETPWTCTVKVRRLAAFHARPQSYHSFSGRGHSQSPDEPTEHGELGEGGERPGKKDKEVLRIKVATLSPTPHHPKVVAMLKVPFPLPDIDVERMIVHKREAGRGSLNANTGPKPGGLLLTAEEIKDVVCSTGLWLVVREGFGGIGKVNRKGDGWRIRG